VAFSKAETGFKHVLSRRFYFKTASYDAASVSWQALSPGVVGVVLLTVRTVQVQAWGRGLHSSTSQLNLSRVSHKRTP